MFIFLNRLFLNSIYIVVGLIVVGPTSHALSTDHQTVLGLQLQLVQSWDRINLLAVKNYKSCFCQKFKDHSLCKSSDFDVSTFTDRYWSTDGQLTSLSQACESKLSDLIDHAGREIKIMRLELALAQNELGFTQSNTYAMAENQRAIRQNPELAITININHVHHSELTTYLDPLNENEIEEALKIYKRESFLILEYFLASFEYKKIYGNLNLSEDDLEPAILYGDLSAQLRIKNELQTTQMLDAKYRTLDYLFAMFIRFAQPMRQKFRQNHLARYLRRLDRLPVLGSIKGYKVDHFKYFESLEIVLKNAEKRVATTHKISSASLADDLSIMDNSLAATSLPNALVQQKGWSEEKATRLVEELLKLRAAKLKNKFYLQTAQAIALLSSCIALSPILGPTQPVLRVLAPNMCFITASVGTNTYFMHRAMSSHRELMSLWLSTFDGYNQIVRLNTVMEKDSEAKKIMLFYLLDVIPATHFLREVRKLLR